MQDWPLFGSGRAVVAKLMVDSRNWTGREPRGGLAEALAPLRKWLARCPVCKGARKERIWSSQMIGDIHIACAGCDGNGSLRAWERNQ